MIIEKTVYRSRLPNVVMFASKDYYLVEFEGTAKDLNDAPYITGVWRLGDDVIGSVRNFARVGPGFYICKIDKDYPHVIPVAFRPYDGFIRRNPDSSLFIIETSDPQGMLRLALHPMIHNWFDINSGYGFSITADCINPYKIAENSWAEMIKKENDMPPRLDIKFDCSQFFRMETIEPTARRVVPSIKNVIFNYPATIVLWDDGTKTVVKCGERDPYSREAGLALCIAKKALGNKGNWYNEFKKHIKDDDVDSVNVEEFIARIESIRKDIESVQKEKYIEHLNNILETIQFNKKTVLQLPVILNADVLDALEWLLTETLKKDKSQK